MVHASNDELDSSEEEEDESGDVKITLNGVEALIMALRYFKQHVKATPDDMMLLQK